MDFVRPVRSVPMQLVAGRGHYESVISAVREARVSVWIATANLKDLMVEDERWSVRRKRRTGVPYRSILGVLADRKQAGVGLRILHATTPSSAFRRDLKANSSLTKHSSLTRKASTRASVSEKSQGSFEMRMCPRVHLKLVIVDGRFLYLGSANFTGAGLGAKGTGRRNFEMGIITDDTFLLDESQETFDRIWRGTECVRCLLRGVCPSPCDSVQRGDRAPSR